MEQWLLFGIIKTILVIFLILVQKYEKSCKGHMWPILTHCISTIFLLFYAFNSDNINNFKNINYPLVLLCGFIISIVVIISYDIIKKAPNPAYLRIFSATDMVIVLLISVYYFNEKLTYKMIVGFLLITLGVLTLTVL